MKIYDTKTAPTPRRVRIFLAEKGIEMEYVQVDLAKGENLSKQMRAKNPIGKIPVLELDDGTCIGESDAICTYFEALQPEPALMGTTPLEKGIISMWQRQIEMCLFSNLSICFFCLVMTEYLLAKTFLSVPPKLGCRYSSLI